MGDVEIWVYLADSERERWGPAFPGLEQCGTRKVKERITNFSSISWRGNL